MIVGTEIEETVTGTGSEEGAEVEIKTAIENVNGTGVVEVHEKKKESEIVVIGRKNVIEANAIVIEVIDDATGFRRMVKLIMRESMLRYS